MRSAATPTATDDSRPSWTLKPGRAMRKPPLRNGCSMSSVLTAAMKMATPARAMRTGSVSVSMAMGTRMRIGQCQRYSEYEMRPR